VAAGLPEARRQTPEARQGRSARRLGADALGRARRLSAFPVSRTAL
jgi:hypothetical protein